MGVDLGIVKTFVATVATDSEYTAPFHPSRKICKLSERIDMLQSRHMSHLYELEVAARSGGREERANVL